MTFPITPNPGIHKTDIAAGPTPFGSSEPQLAAMAQALFNAFSTNVINAILNSLGLSSFQGPFQAALTALENALHSTPTAPLQALIDGVSGGTANPIATLINNLIYGIGTIDPARISHVPISAIGNGNPTSNLILNGAFTGQGALSGAGVWSWDGTTDHSSIVGSGSAKTTANGTAAVLLSNPMAVTSGQNFTFSGYTQWSGLTSTGSPIWLGLQTYLNGASVSTPTIQTAGSSLGSSGSWTHLTGTYTVPAGIDTVRVALNVGSTATAGHVWFDDLSAIKTGLMSGSWMSGISSTVASDLQTMTDYFQALLGSSSTGNPLSSIATAFANLVDGAGLVHYSALPQITIGGVSNDIQSHFQNLVDGTYQAMAGGSLTGNPVSSVKPGLLAIPAGNIVGLIGGGTVAEGAVGAGSSSATTSSGSKNITWSHTIGGSDNYVVVAIGYMFFSSAGFFGRTVTYGGTSMSSLGYKALSSIGYVELFGLANPASGAQTVSVTVSTGSPTFYALAGDSVSYDNWSATTSASTATGSGNPALSVPSATNSRAVCAFVALNSSSTCTISAFNQTSRYAVNSVYNATPNYSLALVLGDAAGASSVSFSATSTNTVYSAIGVSLT